VESVSKLAEQLKETQEFCHILKGYLHENFIIEGKTMIEWKKQFKITIPEDINFMSLVDMASDIMIKYQHAAYYRDSQQVQLTIMEQTKLEKYHTEYNHARAENEKKFGKPLAAESCKAAASFAIQALETSISNQKVIHSFWHKTCDTLTEMRKLVELMCYAISGDARVQKDLNIRGEH